MSQKITVGVDVGGTNIKLGLVNSSGRIISRSRLVTKSYIHNKKTLISALGQAILDLLSTKDIKKRDVCGIGIGLPGLIDPQNGVVKVLPNIPGWKNVPLKKLLQSQLKIPTFLENDVNLITLAEWKFGAGKGYKNFICITLGTGVGGGLIFDNEIYRGAGFAAGEIGHIPINENGKACNCGGWGCFESYVGNKSILKRAKQIIKKPLKEMKDVYRLAKRKDKKALKLWDEMAEHLAAGLVGPINLLNPELIVIGGGISNHYPFFIKQVKAIVKNRAMSVQGRMVKFARAKLGDDAGIVGAQVLVKEAISGN